MITIRRKLNRLLKVEDILRINNIKYINIGDSYRICCPFHKEDTPSCFISGEKKVFHCFGCNASGDLIKLISKIKNKYYREIISDLLIKYGLKDGELNNYGYEYLPILSELDKLKEIEKDLQYIINTKYELLKIYLSRLPYENIFSDMFVNYYKLINEIEYLEEKIVKLRVDIFDAKHRKV